MALRASAPSPSASVGFAGTPSDGLAMLDSARARMNASQRLLCELTLRKGQVAWDLNGLASDDWQSFQYRKGPFFKKP